MPAQPTSPWRRTSSRRGLPSRLFSREPAFFERAGDVGATWRDNTYPGLTKLRAAEVRINHEAQIDHIAQLIKLLSGEVRRKIEPKQEAADKFNVEAERTIKHTVWATGGCPNWYYDKQGKVVSRSRSCSGFEADPKHPRFEELDAP